jgi:hypothetical protein
MLDTSILLNLGELDEQCREFQELAVEVRIELDRLRLETCAEREECLHLPRLIEDGIERLRLIKEDSLLFLL